MPWGSYDIYEYTMGGKRGARWDAHLKLAAMWPTGSGPEIPRLVLKADDVSLDAVCYSFTGETRMLGMRLCRIADGRYRVSVLRDPGGQGKGGETLWKTEKDLRRFDVVDLPIPPKTPVLIRVERLSASERPAALPDLAIDPWEASMKGTTVTALVHNIGNAPVRDAVVRLLDGERVVQEKTVSLDAPVDFKAKRTTLTFENVQRSNALRIVLDPGNTVVEILEKNNEVAVRK